MLSKPAQNRDEGKEKLKLPLLSKERRDLLTAIARRYGSVAEELNDLKEQVTSKRKPDDPQKEQEETQEEDSVTQELWVYICTKNN